MTRTKKPDVHVSGGGSVYLFTPLTRRAKRWVRDNVQLESWQWLGNGFGVEHRYAGDLAAGMAADGLIVR